MKGSPKSLLMENYKASGKSKNKMGGHRPEWNITDPKSTIVEETNRRQRRMEASSDGGQVPEVAVAT
jgi:hypothetical protein